MREKDNKSYQKELLRKFVNHLKQKYQKISFLELLTVDELKSDPNIREIFEELYFSDGFECYCDRTLILKKYKPIFAKYDFHPLYL